MARTIFHADLDAFFVAVERAQDPSLTGKPVIVGGSVDARGVVACASYEARQFGVHSAMPMAVARRLCPDAVYLRGRHDLYRTVSHQFMDILRSYSPLVEPVSVDEAYVDMTGTEALAGPPAFAAANIRERVAKELDVTVSIGIGSSKLIAKVASGACKPDGMLEVKPEDSAAFLAPMPIRKLPGLGPKTAEILNKLDIHKIGELAASEPGPLRRALGANHADSLQRRARGIDDSPVAPESEAKSISAETTFQEDSEDDAFLDLTLMRLSEKVGSRLRKAERFAKTVTLKLRYHDFETISRQSSLPEPSDGDTAIYTAGRLLLDQALRHRKARVRLLGVGVSGFTDRSRQMSLFEAASSRDSTLSNTIDGIRERFGQDAIGRARAVKSRHQ